MGLRSLCSSPHILLGCKVLPEENQSSNAIHLRCIHLHYAVTVRGHSVCLTDHGSKPQRDGFLAYTLLCLACENEETTVTQAALFHPAKIML